jgi:hypothetical protein
VATAVCLIYRSIHHHDAPRTYALIVLELSVPVASGALAVFVWQRGKP